MQQFSLQKSKASTAFSGPVTVPVPQTVQAPYPPVNPSVNQAFPLGYAAPGPSPPSYNEAISSPPLHDVGPKYDEKDALASPAMQFSNTSVKPSAPDLDD